MALYDTPPHRVTVLAPLTTQDAAGGTVIEYAPVLTAVPCSINTLSSSEVARFAAAQVRVTHTVAFYAADLPGGLMPGYVLQAEDTGQRYRIQGIRHGRAYGTIPPLVYAEVEHIL